MTRWLKTPITEWLLHKWQRKNRKVKGQNRNVDVDNWPWKQLDLEMVLKNTAFRPKEMFANSKETKEWKRKIYILSSELQQSVECFTKRNIIYEQKRNGQKFSYDLKELSLSRGLFHTFDLYKLISECRPCLVPVEHWTDLQSLFEFLAF